MRRGAEGHDRHAWARNAFLRATGNDAVVSHGGASTRHGRGHQKSTGVKRTAAPCLLRQCNKFFCSPRGLVASRPRGPVAPWPRGPVARAVRNAGNTHSQIPHSRISTFYLVFQYDTCARGEVLSFDFDFDTLYTPDWTSDSAEQNMQLNPTLAYNFRPTDFSFMSSYSRVSFLRAQHRPHCMRKHCKHSIHTSFVIFEQFTKVSSKRGLHKKLSELRAACKKMVNHCPRAHIPGTRLAQRTRDPPQCRTDPSPSRGLLSRSHSPSRHFPRHNHPTQIFAILQFCNV